MPSGSSEELTESESNIQEAPEVNKPVFGGHTLRHKKMEFDESLFTGEGRYMYVTFLHGKSSSVLATNFEDLILNPPVVSVENARYFCDWFPVLFGIDEDEIESSDEEKNLLEDVDMDDLNEKANLLTESTMEALRCEHQYLGDEELREIWKWEQVPRYGRRAKEKPLYYNENKERFDCLCEMDENYLRHYVPHFGGGTKEEGGEWRVPHFVSYWEEFWEKANDREDENWSKIFERTPTPEETGEKGLFFRPKPTFPGFSASNQRKFRQSLLNRFRPLDCREVRRFRMPHAEALYLELQEDGYLDSAAFFKYLIVKDYFLHQSQKNTKSAFRESKDTLKKVVAFLKVAEKCARRKNVAKQTITYIKSGKYFNDQAENWWWLAEEFFLKAVRVSQKIIIDGGKMEAISRYIYGTFLLDSVYRVQAAQEHLSKARDLSVGKDWNAGSILKKEQEPVYKECANSLSRALIAASNELRKSGKAEEALPLIHRAYKLCQESETSRPDIKMETLFELGMTYQAVGMIDWAKEAFRRFLEIAKLENYKRSLCDGYLEIAICYRSEGVLSHCHHYLAKYLETAQKAEDKNLIAFGNRYLGEFHLNNGDPKIAAEFFTKAFESFHEQCKETQNIPFADWQPENFTLPHDVELSRVLVGLAEGEMLTKSICNLILQARDGKNQNEALSLSKWKNNGDRTFLLNETKYEEPSFLIDGDSFATKLQLGLSFKGSISSSEEYVEMDTEARTVRFALKDSDGKTIIL